MSTTAHLHVHNVAKRSKAETRTSRTASFVRVPYKVKNDPSHRETAERAEHRKNEYLAVLVEAGQLREQRPEHPVSEPPLMKSDHGTHCAQIVLLDLRHQAEE